MIFKSLSADLLLYLNSTLLLSRFPERVFSSVTAFHFAPKKKDLHHLQNLKGPQDLQSPQDLQDRQDLQELAASRQKIQYEAKNTRTPGGTQQILRVSWP